MLSPFGKDVEVTNDDDDDDNVEVGGNPRIRRGSVLVNSSHGTGPVQAGDRWKRIQPIFSLLTNRKLVAKQKFDQEKGDHDDDDHQASDGDDESEDMGIAARILAQRPPPLMKMDSADPIDRARLADPRLNKRMAAAGAAAPADDPTEHGGGGGQDKPLGEAVEDQAEDESGLPGQTGKAPSFSFNPGP